MNKVKPTKLQKRTLEILAENPDMPLGKAMITAGYAENVARSPKQNFLGASGVQNVKQQWIEVLAGRGINTDKLADKYKEWLDAQKVVSARSTGKEADSGTDDFIEVPDYQTQIKAAEMIREDFGLKQQNSPSVTLNFTQLTDKQREDYGI